MTILRSGHSDPDDLRLFYRFAIMQAIRTYEGGRRYRAVVEQDLRPLLNAAGRPEWCGAFRGSILGLATFGSVTMSDQERAYVTALGEFVQQRLRITEEGMPAAWVVHAVHADVCDVDDDAAWFDARSIMTGEGRGSGYQASAARIQIEVVDDGEFSVDARLATPTQPPQWSSGPNRFDKGRQWDIQLPILGSDARAYVDANGFRMTSQDWEQLEEIAIDAVRSAIQALRTEHERQTVHYSQKYSNFKAGVLDTYAPALIRWAWGRDDTEARGMYRNQVNTMIKAIGIDRPGTISKPGSHSKS